MGNPAKFGFLVTLLSSHGLLNRFTFHTTTLLDAPSCTVIWILTVGADFGSFQVGKKCIRGRCKHQVIGSEGVSYGGLAKVPTTFFSLELEENFG